MSPVIMAFALFVVQPLQGSDDVAIADVSDFHKLVGCPGLRLLLYDFETVKNIWLHVNVRDKAPTS